MDTTCKKTITLTAVERDGLDLRLLNVTFLTDMDVTPEDLLVKLRKIATEWCKTEDGKKTLVYNCGQFNLADFEANIPNEFCEKFGIQIQDSEPAYEIDWDMQLVDESELEEELEK